MQHRKPSLLFDLQSLQNGSSTRGIGRYTREHFGALLAESGSPFELHGSLDLTYQHQAEELLGEFCGAMASDRLHGYRYPSGLWSAYPTTERESVFAEELVRLHVEALAPDIVHIPSLFEGAVEHCASLGRVARARGSVTSCLVHDLIPLVMSDHYLSDSRIRDWYQHKTQQLREFDVLLTNSEASKADAIKLLDVDPQRIHVIYAGYPEVFRPPADLETARARLSRRLGITTDYVLYTGNNDYRKNTRGAIAGFAGVPREFREGMVLVLTQTEAEQELRQFAQQCGLEPTSLVLAGYVTDADLIDLYACCHAFVFPSLYEGFGLPVVEAMACGAPVLVGDNSSLKEIVMLDQARFDANDPAAITTALKHVLQDESWRGQLREYGLNRVREFSWKRTAQLSIQAWQSAREQAFVGTRTADSHSRIAIVLPAQVADQSVKTWIDQVSLFSRGANVELASAAPTQWPSYMHVQKFPEDPLSEDAGLDVVTVLHSDVENGVIRGLAFPGVRVEEVRGQWQGLHALLSTGSLPQADYALPDLMGDCMGVLDAGDSPVPLTDAVSQMVRRGAVEVVSPVLTPEIVLDWVNQVRFRYANLSVAAITAVLKPCLPLRAGDIAAGIAETLATVGNIGAPRRVLIDISELARVDYGTGIQRVVRNLVRELCAHNGEGRLLFVPVYHDGEHILSAHAVVRKLLGVECPVFDEREGIRGGDILFLADSAWVGPERFLRSIAQARRQGGDVAVFFHDIIPLRFPQTCGEGMPQAFRAWTEFAVAHADRFICNSRTTARDLMSWITEFKPQRRSFQRFGWVHLGSDVMELGASAAVRAEMADLFEQGSRTFIAVGTLEPRKDYSTILAAFEEAWGRGSTVKLLIIGKSGWGVDDLVARIRLSPYFNTQLFWPERVTNAELDLAYRSAAGLIQASLSEGFGLPIVEAARYGTPLLLSDIEVFREIAGEHASYFAAGDAGALAASLDGRDLRGSGELSKVVLSWREYGKQMRRLLLEGPWEESSIKGSEVRSRGGEMDQATGKLGAVEKMGGGRR